MTPSQALRAVARGWEEGNPDAVAALFAEDGIFDDPLQPRRRTGPAEIRSALAGGMAAIHQCRIPLGVVIESGSVGFAEGMFQSKLAGSETRFDFPFVMVVEMKDGKIARLGEYFDTKSLR